MLKDERLIVVNPHRNEPRSAPAPLRQPPSSAYHLPLAPGVDRRSFRLLLMGALNWSQSWYRPGRDDPTAIARRFTRMLRASTATA